MTDLLGALDPGCAAGGGACVAVIGTVVSGVGRITAGDCVACLPSDEKGAPIALPRGCDSVECASTAASWMLRHSTAPDVFISAAGVLVSK